MFLSLNPENPVTKGTLRILVIGADGIIGSALYNDLLRRGHTVIGTTRREPKERSSRLIFLDLAGSQMVKECLPEADVAIICAAGARFVECRLQPDRARRVNVTAPVILVRRLVERGTYVARLSSSRAVFGCRTTHVRADQPPAPRSVYGRLQAEAEEAILKFGRGARIEAFEDHTPCPLPLSAAADAAAAVLESRQGRIFQVSETSDISYADLAGHLVRRLGLSQSRVIPTGATDKGISETDVPPFTSMDTIRLTEMTDFIPPDPFCVFDKIFDGMITRFRESASTNV